jgi:hypothetical protein
VLAPASGASTYLLADDATFGPAEPAASAEEPAAAGAADTLAGDSNVGGDAGDLPAPRSNAGGTTRSVRGASAQPSGAISRTKSIVINEVMYDPMTTPDADGEWVELYNAGDATVSLDGWSLADASSNVALSELIIAPHGFAIVAASDAFDDAYADYDGVLVVLGRRIGNSLGNDGDRLTLLDATGATVDAISWGGDASAFEPSIDDVPAGHSIERRVTGADTDRAGDWVDNERPSPGRAIDAVAGGAQLHGGTIQAVPNRVEVLAADGGNGLTWLPWAMFAAAAAALAGVGAWRLAPAVATRLRHQP